MHFQVSFSSVMMLILSCGKNVKISVNHKLHAIFKNYFNRQDWELIYIYIYMFFSCGINIVDKPLSRLLSPYFFTACWFLITCYTYLCAIDYLTAQTLDTNQTLTPHGWSVIKRGLSFWLRWSYFFIYFKDAELITTRAERK